MANRYVWERYNVNISYSFSRHDTSYSPITEIDYRDTNAFYMLGLKRLPTVNSSSRATYSGDYFLVDAANSQSHRISIATYPYVTFVWGTHSDLLDIGLNTYNLGAGNGTVSLSYSGGWCESVFQAVEDSGYWSMFVGNDSYDHWPNLGCGSTAVYPGSPSYQIRDYRITSSRSQGSTSYGPITSANSGAYPSNGSSGSNWYVYQGSDNIDPASVTIPASIQGGTSIDITVTPSTGKKYGGTVSYTYQYKLDNGGWQALSGPTTATTQQLTVPKGTASVQVQVRAQDNLGFTSSTWVASETVAVTNNQPPTAPGSINATNVVGGRDATITLTAATDPDGSVASYIYQRSVDSGMWQQFAQANTLTQTDTVSNSWGTVQYRACAVDNEGAQGPFATSTLYTVTSGLLVIGGPNPSLGELDRQFKLTLNINVTGVPSLTDIDVQATLDGAGIYTGQVDSGGVATIPVDARVLYTGAHTIRVTVSHDDYEPATAEYTFTVPTVSMPDGGRALVGQTPDGEPAFFYTTAQAVFCQGGTLADVLVALQGGSVAPLLEPVIKEAPPSGSFALSPGVLYDFTQADASALTFTFEAPAAGKAAAYHVMFKSGSTAATVTLPDGVKTPDGYVIEANRVYELSILQNMLAYQSWGAS